MQRVLVLPGIANPNHHRYRPFYEAITSETRVRAGSCNQVSYPGHNGRDSGRLSFEEALHAAELGARDLNPDWVIGTSFGALVALALAKMSAEALGNVKGIVLLGPTTLGGMQRVVPDEKARKQVFLDYEVKYNTWLDVSFFETLPCADDLIEGVELPLRLVRGEKDIYNNAEEFCWLCTLYRRNDRGRRIETAEIPGAGHVILPEELTPDVRMRYFRALFEKIDLGVVSGLAVSKKGEV